MTDNDYQVELGVTSTAAAPKQQPLSISDRVRQLLPAMNSKQRNFVTLKLAEYDDAMQQMQELVNTPSMTTGEIDAIQLAHRDLFARFYRLQQILASYLPKPR